MIEVKEMSVKQKIERKYRKINEIKSLSIKNIDGHQKYSKKAFKKLFQ